MEKCKKCGKEMKIGFKKQVFCSDGCRKAYYSTRKTFNCVICGNELTGKQKYYCSEECSKKAVAKREYEYHKEMHKKPKAEPEVEVVKKKRGRPKKWEKELADFNAKARAEGLSYGQYVGKYGL